MSNITNLTFTDETYPGVVRIANELSKVMDRSPHDSIRRLIEEYGPKMIESEQNRRSAARLVVD